MNTFEDLADIVEGYIIFALRSNHSKREIAETVTAIVATRILLNESHFNKDKAEAT